MANRLIEIHGDKSANAAHDSQGRDKLPACPFEIIRQLAARQASSLSLRPPDFRTRELERQHGLIMLYPLVDLTAFGPREAIEAKSFHGEAGHNAAVDHAPTEPARRRSLVRFQVSHDATGKTIAR